MSHTVNTSISIATRYEPVALYYSEADIVEYLRSDVPCAQRRVDEYLTLCVDIFTRDVIGFRLKGFKNFYLQHLRKTQQVFDHDRFLSLVSAIEKTIEIVGHGVFEIDRQRAAGYEEARKVAREDNVVICEDELIAA